MIDINKKYRTKEYGYNVRIICTDAVSEGGLYPVVALVRINGNDVVTRYTENGSYLHSNGSRHDLVEITPYYDFKIDDPVLVWDRFGETPQKRYFAGVDKGGDPTTFANGATSFSAPSDISPVPWNHCVKYNGE